MNSENDCLSDGVYAASLTPLQTDFRCDHRTLALHCNELLSKGCQGVVLFGTTGEGASFSVLERLDGLRNVLSEGIEAKKIILGIICSSVEDAVTLISAACEHDCAAVLVVPPYFFKGVKEQGVVDFYRQVIQKVRQPNLRIILYHIPQLSGVPITLNIVRSLRSEFPNIIVGLKESEGNLSFTKEILTHCPGFKVLVGKEAHIAEAARLGAYGAICGVANVFPEAICSLYNHAQDQDFAMHTDLVNEILKILKKYSGIAALKCLVAKRKGPSWKLLRPPLVSLNEHECLELNDELAKPDFDSLMTKKFI